MKTLNMFNDVQLTVGEAITALRVERDHSVSAVVVAALEMAIEALDENDVLDKIRAEIEAKCCITVGRENDGAITLHDVFEIIDKYKAESER